MILDDRTKKQLISVLNNGIGINVIKDITLSPSPTNEDIIVVECHMSSEKSKSCLIPKSLIKILKNPIIKWL